MSIILIGYGRMGQAIEMGLRILDKETKIITADINTKSGADHYLDCDDSQTIENFFSIHKPNVVISSLPYYLNANVAEAICHLDNPKPFYIDLGGDNHTSDVIHDMCDDAKVKCFTDMGLAPGLVNIIAEMGYQTMVEHGEKPHTIKMYCGGLPLTYELNNFLKYECTWSGAGLVNEYTKPSNILSNGEIIQVWSLSGLEKLRDVDGTRNFEAFYTSGGAAHTLAKMQERGVKNCFYKTLRYEGHQRVVKFLWDVSLLSREELRKVLESRKNQRDIVHIRVVVEGDKLSYRKDLQVLWGPTSVVGEDLPQPAFGREAVANTATAMQKATAFPVATLAFLAIHGRIESEKSVLGYDDVPMKDFFDCLSSLRIWR